MAAQWRICRTSWSGRNWERSRSCVIIHYYSPKTTLPPLPSPSFPLLFRFDSAISLRFFFASIPRNWNCVLQLSINFDYSFHNFIFSFDENFERGTILEAKEETKNTPLRIFIYESILLLFYFFLSFSSDMNFQTWSPWTGNFGCFFFSLSRRRRKWDKIK